MTNITNIPKKGRYTNMQILTILVIEDEDSLLQLYHIEMCIRDRHISQPPLSAQMKLLEDELGVVLFERGSRSIFLTEAGKVFYEKALHILHLTTAVSDELQQMGQGLRGPLHMGMISSVQTPRLIRALSSFVSLHPEVTLRISEGNTYELMDQINSGLIEVAVRCV